jgi:hypothetical protein
LNAGNNTLSVNFPETTNYLAGNTTVQLTVNPQPVVVTIIMPADLVYNGSPKAVTLSCTAPSFIAASATVTYKLGAAAATTTAPTVVGDYTVSAALNAGLNYTGSNTAIM